MRKEDLDRAIEIVADWWATEHGTPSCYIGVPTKEDAEMLADEIAYKLNLGARVTGPKATVKSDWAAVIDREQ